MSNTVNLPSEEVRRSLFAALVETQDKGVSVPDSRQKVARQFGVGVDQVRQAELEGLEHQWPPLDS
jgi:predicted nuclease of restriction endonuclease-like RecB superfamily